MAANGGSFKKGHSIKKGKSSPGSGRTPDWLKVEASKIGDPLEVIRFYWNVARGEEMEQVVTDAGESISTPAQVKDRLKAGELYLDRVVGKVTQPMEHSGDIGSRLVFIHPATGTAETR